MNILDKKRITWFGIRIGILYLTAFCILAISAYFVISQNFQSFLADYSLKMVQSMVDQGVKTVEYELEAGRKEIKLLADIFTVPKNYQEAQIPEAFLHTNTKRVVYVTQEGSAASDGRGSHIIDRPDIQEAFQGKVSVYGPYFNEENEYIICCSAPVYRDGEITGVLSMEKDGYYISSLIEGIRFNDSGECYIINEEGTDIAVSNREHMEWVTNQYNAGHLLEEREDEATRSVFELEKKGLAGEKGMGTYEWDGSLCYLVYQPVPSSGWVLLAGLRDEEIQSMIQSVMKQSLTKGPALSICILLFLVLTGAILFWIILSLKRSRDMNNRLEIAANYDPLTSLMNRNGFHRALETLSAANIDSLSCIYIDANGLHEINNHLGHQAGDKMLKSLAALITHIFPPNSSYRIGGDEFVVLYQNCTKQDACQKCKILRDNLKNQGYEISVGISWSDEQMNIKAMVNAAEHAMQKDKKQFYSDNGKERQLRALDEELEQMLLEKQDADTFLSVLAPEYKGVYFVNLDNDSIRHLYIPPYFESILKEEDNLFSRALYVYAKRYVMPDYLQQFDKICDYGYLKTLLNNNMTADFIYQKYDGTWIKLQILKFKMYTEKNRETLWIFSAMEGED